jgi:hypothetical protein
VLAAQGDQRRRQQRAHRGREGTDAQRAGQPGRHRGQRRRRVLQRGQDRLGVLDEDPAGPGEGDAPAGALQQRDARLSLQHGQLLGNRRRGVGVGARDGGDRAEAGQVAEQLQAAYIEH